MKKMFVVENQCRAEDLHYIEKNVRILETLRCGSQLCSYRDRPLRLDLAKQVVIFESILYKCLFVELLAWWSERFLEMVFLLPLIITNTQ